MIEHINVCMNRKGEPRIFLEVCKVAVSIQHRLCMKRVGPRVKALRCPIARTLLAELKEVP